MAKTGKAGGGNRLPKQPGYKPKGKYDVKELVGPGVKKVDLLGSGTVRTFAFTAQAASLQGRVSSSQAFVQVMESLKGEYIGASLPQHVVDHGLRCLRGSIKEDSIEISSSQNPHVTILLPSKNLSPAANELKEKRGAILSFNKIGVSERSGKISIYATDVSKNIGYGELVSFCKETLLLDENTDIPQSVIGRLEGRAKENVIAKLKSQGIEPKKIGKRALKMFVIDIPPVSCTVTVTPGNL